MSKGPQQRKEPLSLRIEPKIKYLIEIASRVQRRNISNYVEFTLENSLRDVEIEKNKSVLQMAEYLWSTHEGERVLHLAEKYPELLVYDEQKTTDIMKKMGVFFQNHTFTKKAYWYYEIIKSSLDGSLNELPYIYMIDSFYSTYHDSDGKYRAKYMIKAFIERMLSNESEASGFELLAWNILRSSAEIYGILSDQVADEYYENPAILDDLSSYNCENITDLWVDLLLDAPFPDAWSGSWQILEECVSPTFRTRFPNFDFSKSRDPI